MAGRTPLFSSLARTIRSANDPTPRSGTGPTRREFLRGAASAAAIAALPAFPFASRPIPRIAIVGAGLAGLSAADRLQAKGVVATVFEGQDHPGGRCLSLRGFLPGQVAELGGELIDTPHKTMLGYANRFDLPLEDLGKQPGDVAYYFNGVRYSEAEVIDQYRVLVARTRADLRSSSGAPTFFDHTAADVALDNVSLEEYLETRAADLPLIRKLLKVAYEIEYGADAADQSCLNLLLFIHADRRSKLALWGVFSDERYHVTSGNDGIVQGLASDFRGAIEYGRKLVRLGKNASGEYEMRFQGSGAVVRADAVILTIPFSALRDVQLDASLGLSADKRRAISELGYGTNAKTMIAFNGVPWLSAYDNNGSAYSDLANLQTCWETNPTTHGATSILTDYAAGTRGESLSQSGLQSQVDAFLSDLDVVLPGLKSQAKKAGGNYVAKLQDWPSNPWTRGSYTSYKPGQFTTIAGLEAQRAGHLHFAGEHADSFYSWQGYMEGACLSGIAAANEVLGDIKAGLL